LHTQLAPWQKKVGNLKSRISKPGKNILGSTFYKMQQYEGCE